MAAVKCDLVSLVITTYILERSLLRWREIMYCISTEDCYAKGHLTASPGIGHPGITYRYDKLAAAVITFLRFLKYFLKFEFVSGN